MKAFQLRSRAVRAASQDLMRRLREDRAAASRHTRKVMPAVPHIAPDAPAERPTDIKPSRRILTASSEDAAPPAIKTEPPAKPRKPKARPVPAAPAAVEAPAEAAVEPAPRAGKPRPRKTKAAPVQALQQVLAETFAAVEAVAETDPGRAAMPVSAVPTLGPGMVWRLNQLGVATLGDLAGQDADTLKQQLGRLGRMVNVEQWIAYARNA